MSQYSIVPATVAARGLPRRKWLPFGFTPRFLILLLMGLVWLIPAWWSPRFIAVMWVWDAVVLLVWLGDLLQLPAPGTWQVERHWKEALSLGRWSGARVELHNDSRRALRAAVVDETPLAFLDTPPQAELAIAAGDSAAADYQVHPHSRGDIAMGSVYFRYRSALGMAERWAMARADQKVRVMPDLVRARNYALYLIRSRQVEMEKRRRRQRGVGREFESLREYRQGDELRTVHWPATARRHQLITRTFQVERSQAVWIVLDAGRLMRAQVHDPERGLFVSKLDYAVDAALALAQVATQSGDRVGLLAYGRNVQQSVGLGRGASHVRTLLDALAQVKAEVPEADHAQAVRTLLHAQSQRSLIVWITDFAETATVPEVIEHATLMKRRHLVVFAAVSQPDLAALTNMSPKDEDDMYRVAAAIEVAERRERLLRRLRDQGVLAIDLEPGRLTDAVLNQYLEIKDRSLL